MDAVDALTLTDLRGVIPVPQSKAIGEFTINLISLEVWDGCILPNLSVIYPSIRKTGRGRTPRLDVFIGDEDQPSNNMRRFTGYGGGLKNGLDGHRFEYRYRQIPLGQSFRLDVKLSIGEYTIPQPKEKSSGGWFGYGLEREWTDIGVYSFDVMLPEQLIQPSSRLGIERPPLRHRFERREPIDTSAPSRVIPIVQSREANDWLLTLVALESSNEGMLLTSRVRGPLDPNQAMPTLRLAVRDDLGNQYAVWSSTGGGDAMNGDRLQFRWFTSIEPALDPNARALFVDAIPDFDMRDTCMLPGGIPDGEAMFEFVVVLE